MRVSRTVIAKWLMVLLSAIIMANLNGVFGVYLKIAEPFSPMILACCVAIIPLVSPRLRFYHFGFYLFWLFFVSYWVIGLLASLYYDFDGGDVWDETRDIITTLIIFTTYYTYVRSLANKQALTAFMHMLLVVFVATALGGVMERQLGLSSVYFGEQTLRTLGFFGNPNETGLQCNLLLLIASYLFVDNRLKLWLFAPIVAVALLGSLYSFSKSAMILSGFLLLYCLVYLFLYFGRINRIMRLRYIAFFGIVLITAIGFVLPAFTEFYAEAKSYERRRIDAIYELVVEGEINEKTTSERSRLIPQALSLIAQRPFSGYGLHAFSKTGLVDENIGVHNTYLKILGEGGVIAFLFWATFILFLLVNAVQIKGGKEAYFIIGIVLVISAYFMISHTILSRKFAIPLLAIAAAMIHSPYLVLTKPRKT